MGNASSGLGQVDEASKPASVLVVEDDPAVANVLRDVLAEDGYVVLPVASGGAALRSANQADLVLLDLGCPIWTA